MMARGFKANHQDPEFPANSFLSYLVPRESKLDLYMR